MVATKLTGASAATTTPAAATVSAATLAALPVTDEQRVD
jgi:hypothetical protein